MHEIRRVGVLGCGLMGSGIAQTAATAGLTTLVRDVEDGLLARGESAIQKSLDKLVEKGKLDAATRERALAQLTFTTDLGWLDVMATPAGTDGYDDLAAGADATQAFGEQFLVASVDDLIRMKRAAGRPKDRVELEILGALRDEMEGA